MKKEKKRENINTTLDSDLYSSIQMLAVLLTNKSSKKIYANDLIEEGMQHVLDKYNFKSPL